MACSGSLILCHESWQHNKEALKSWQLIVRGRRNWTRDRDEKISICKWLRIENLCRKMYVPVYVYDIICIWYDPYIHMYVCTCTLCYDMKYIGTIDRYILRRKRFCPSVSHIRSAEARRKVNCRVHHARGILLDSPLNNSTIIHHGFVDCRSRSPSGVGSFQNLRSFLCFTSGNSLWQWVSWRWCYP